LPIRFVGLSDVSGVADVDLLRCANVLLLRANSHRRSQGSGAVCRGSAATNAINAAMLKTLWDSYRVSEFDLPGNDNVDWGELELRLYGTLSWYFDRRNCEAFAALKRAKIAA